MPTARQRQSMLVFCPPSPPGTRLHHLLSPSPPVTAVVVVFFLQALSSAKACHRRPALDVPLPAVTSGLQLIVIARHPLCQCPSPPVCSHPPSRHHPSPLVGSPSSLPPTPSPPIGTACHHFYLDSDSMWMMVGRRLADSEWQTC